MIFSELFQKAFVEPFPLEEIKQSVYAYGTTSIGWRGQVFMIYGYRLLTNGKIRLMARDAWGVICYLSEEGEVSYPGDASKTLPDVPGSTQATSDGKSGVGASGSV